MPSSTIPISSSDAAIIAASRDDPERFAEIFDRHWSRIYRYCVSRVGADGEDIAAETFRVALHSRRRFDGSHVDAAPWLFGIATNLMRRHRRSETRFSRALTRLRSVEEPALTEGVVDETTTTLAPQVVAALTELTPVYRDALLLHVWGELSYEQVAEATDVSVGTVCSRINRARAHVRAALETEELL